MIFFRFGNKTKKCSSVNNFCYYFGNFQRLFINFFVLFLSAEQTGFEKQSDEATSSAEQTQSANPNDESPSNETSTYILEFPLNFYFYE